MGKDSRMCGCADVQMCGFNQHLNMFIKIYAFILLLRTFDIMATVTIEINKDRDLPTLEAFLKKMGLDYQLDDDDWGDLPQEAISSIKAGLEDIKAGRVHTHEEVVAYMADRLNRLRAKND